MDILSFPSRFVPEQATPFLLDYSTPGKDGASPTSGETVLNEWLGKPRLPVIRRFTRSPAV